MKALLKKSILDLTNYNVEYIIHINLLQKYSLLNLKYIGYFVKSTLRRYLIYNSGRRMRVSFTKGSSNKKLEMARNSTKLKFMNYTMTLISYI